MQPLFSTKERELILDYLLDNPDKEINMNALARELKVSPGQVHHYLAILETKGLFKNKKLSNNPATRALRFIKNLMKLEGAKIIKTIIKKTDKPTGIGVYGSWANGSNKQNSDLDIWIKSTNDLSDLELSKLNRELSERMGVSVELLILTPKRMDHLKNKTEALYYSLFNSITLWGESP